MYKRGRYDGGFRCVRIAWEAQEKGVTAGLVRGFRERGFADDLEGGGIEVGREVVKGCHGVMAKWCCPVGNRANWRVLLGVVLWGCQLGWEGEREHV